MQRLQDQLSSGKLISKPSDSPTGTVSALKLRADLRRGEQLERNANDSIAWLSAADSTMFEGLSVFSRVRNLALQGMNASSGPEELGRASRRARVCQSVELRGGA